MDAVGDATRLQDLVGAEPSAVGRIGGVHDGGVGFGGVVEGDGGRLKRGAAEGDGGD